MRVGVDGGRKGGKHHVDLVGGREGGKGALDMLRWVFLVRLRAGKMAEH